MPDYKSIFSKKWTFPPGFTLPLFTSKIGTEKEVIEPCTLISSKTWNDYGLPDLGFLFIGGTTEVELAGDSSSDHFGSTNTTTSIEPVKRRIGWRRFTGILLALFSTFIYSLATLIIKVFKDYSPFLLSMWRFQGMILPSIPIILYYVYGEKKPLFNSIWPLTDKKKCKTVFIIVLRSLFGCSASLLQIFALQKLNMSDASVIVFSSPVFVVLAAHVFLGEKAGIFSVLMALFTIIGVGIIARPPILTGAAVDSDTLIGTCFALGSMLLAGAVVVILRYLREVHYSVVTISYGILGTLECAVMAGIFNVFDLPHGLWEWAMAIALILFTFIGQTALVISLKFEDAGPISLLGTTDVLFAFLWQFIFLSVVPDMYSVMGAAIVILGVLLTTVRKLIITLPMNHPARVKFSWFLR